MHKVLLRGDQLQSYQSFRRWPRKVNIFAVRQYTTTRWTKSPRRPIPKIHELQFTPLSMCRGFMGGSQDESLISKTKAEGESENESDLNCSSPTAETAPATSSVPSGIMDHLDALATGTKEMTDNTSSTFDLTDTPAAIIKLIDSLARSDLPTSPPSVYIDLEGIDIGRTGSTSILQVYILPTQEMFLVDVHKLGEQAFSTTNTSGVTFKSILESPLIPKVFFDVRCDSDALYSHFGINLAGVIDLQLMELATRSRDRKILRGLAKCMDLDLVQTPEDLKVRSAIKQRGKQLFAPELGGRYEVFNDRPLNPVIADYCVQDVKFMPQLWEIYNAKFGKFHKAWPDKVERETKARVLASQSPRFEKKGPHMAKGPRGW
ncbi:hypothetical protein DSL72_001127 [Monilinia vaccinii-corymbosi]|uniref:3'-5' exonuclease domain-containing protein n=1 Tax=Monilinia vaccinii-corymbosi TaxID=61207 RepID=A0A8A3P4A1_9HELO|nr:hypothetical protein DSL72_001127 [Monilinia vaccinii-corymbosi]